MKKNIVVTEGESDCLLLKTLLETDDNDPRIQFIAAGGWSSADSLARSILAKREHNVALVVDADSIDPSYVEHRKRFLQRSLREIMSSSEWKVIVIEPEIDGLVFQDYELLKKLKGADIDPTDLVQGQYEPKKVLGELFPGKSRLEIYQKLKEFDLSTLREVSSIKELHDFLLGDIQQVAA